MEECWDHDAEARLSASCVVERLMMMRSVMAEASGGQDHTNELHNQLNLHPGPGAGEQMRLIPLNGSLSTNYEDSSSFG